MYKYILSEEGSLNWMAILALLTFFLIFVISTVVVLRRNKTFIDKMANLPLDDAYSSKENQIHEEE